MKRGFSIVEVMLACSLLFLITVVLFSLLSFGFNGFRLASNRNDLQADARAALARLRLDLEMSTLTGVVLDSSLARRATVPLSTGPSVQPRHLICLPALTNWDDPGSFDADTGLPDWDSYILYHAGLQTDKARLFRVELSTGAPHLGQSWPGFGTYTATYLPGPPPKGTGLVGASVKGLRALTNNLLAFEASKSSKMTIITLRLFHRSKGPVEGSRLRDEILEFRARIVPKNLAR